MIPMDVSAVLYGKGKFGKGKDGNGRFGKGREYEGKHGKTKDKDGKNKPTTERFEGECGYCGKLGPQAPGLQEEDLR